MRWNRQASIASLLVVCVRVAGCAVAPTALPESNGPLPTIDDVRVCVVIDPRSSALWAGSAVPIGGNVFVTNLHVFPPPATSMQLDGQTVAIEMISSGGLWRQVNTDGSIARGDDWTDVLRDWQKFRALEGTFEPPPRSQIDFERKVRIGETIYLFGFAGDASKLDRESVKHLKPTILKGRAVQAPKQWDERIIAVQTEVPADHDHFGGMSGGAAVVHDDERDCWVIVGVNRGSVEFRVRFGLWEWSEGSVVQVVRPPSNP
ncbi:MAG: hypothetical protein JNM86_09175 [Phycisphaerae bacterium]|nr:hypothetical protein [Phycisphaerae bacterium]